MTTTEISNRLVSLCRFGDFQTCYQELYSPDCQSIKANGSVCNGLEEMAKKGKEWNESIEEFHGSHIGEPVISGNYFSLPMSLTLKYKGAPEVTKFEEICVYHVKDGKIVMEQFFYDQR